MIAARVMLLLDCLILRGNSNKTLTLLFYFSRKLKSNEFSRKDDGPETRAGQPMGHQ